MTANSREKIAIIDWTHLIEDYLDNIRISFDEFKNEMNGGWLFGYIEALKSVGFEPVFICFSARENCWGTHKHIPTDSEFCVLPSPWIYRRLRKRIRDPYAESVEQACEKLSPLTRPFYSFLLSASEYLSMPLIRLHSELSRGGIKKIISQEYESGRFDELVILSKLTKRHIFASFQGGIESPNKLKAAIRKFTIKHSDGLICGSSNEIHRVRKTYGLAEVKTAKIFNPLSFDMGHKADREKARAKYGIDDNTRVAVWHGRIDLKRKGLDLLVEAWQELRRKNLPFECKLLLFGFGNDAKEFRQLLDSRNDPTIIWFDEFTNDRKKLNEFLSLGDVYVFASRHEGFPVAPIEAMAAGLPLLATNVSGIPDILENGEESGGITVDLEDVAALAKNLEILFLDDDMRSKLGEKAKQRALSAFSIQSAGAQLRQFLTSNDK